MSDTVAPVGAGSKDPSITATTMTLDALEILRVVADNSRAFLKVRDVLYKVSARLDVIETKLSDAPTNSDAEAIEPGPVTEKRPIGPVPRLALRSDGIALLEVTNDVAEEDLRERAVGRYVELSEAEASDALTCAEEGFSTGAAKVAWLLARGRLGYPKADEAPKETP